MQIFANQPMKSIVFIVSAVAIAISVFFVHQVKKAEAAKVAAIEQQAEEVRKQTARIHKVDAKQLKCLTDNIYYEAGNQGTLGQAAVGRVVMNRVKHGFGNSICDVVYKKTRYVKEDEFGTPLTRTLCQFSWVCMDQKPGINHANYAEAKHVAWQILTVDAYHDVLPKNALYFHNTQVSPDWGLQRIKKIGQHVFYSNNKVKSQEK